MKHEKSIQTIAIISFISITTAVATAGFALSEASGLTHLLARTTFVVGATGDEGAKGSTGSTGENGAIGATGNDGAAGLKGITGSSTNWSSVSEDVVPDKDNVYSLGTLTNRWKSLQLGPGTLYIQDQITGAQAGLTVRAGSLLLDGADSLRIGNIQLTATGIKTLTPDTDITIGDVPGSGLIKLARSLEFPDGTIQSSAMIMGLQGAIGITGATGLQGATGFNGDAGLTGPQGLQGIQGIQGEVGPQGIQGVQGESGIKGDKGDKGETGLTGPQGLQGEVGVQGIQGQPGIKGDKGETGLTGDPGSKGDKGDPGAPGTIAPYAKQHVCVVTTGNKRLTYWGTCSSQGLSGADYNILASLP